MAQKNIQRNLPHDQYDVFNGRIMFDVIEQLGHAMTDLAFTATLDGIYLFTFTANSGEPSSFESPVYPQRERKTRVRIMKSNRDYTEIPDQSPEFSKHISWVWMSDMRAGERFYFEVTQGWLLATPTQPVIFTAEYTGYVNSDNGRRGQKRPHPGDR